MASLFQGRGFDAAVASVTAASVAFFVAAMPSDLFSAFIETSGLPALVPAAQPPLGSTARLAALIAGGTFGFLAVWMVLGTLSRPAPQRKQSKKVQSEPDRQTPRVRRADAHPDAPVPRPIFAGLDLGEPADERNRSIALGSRNDEIPAPKAPAFAADLPPPVQEEALELGLENIVPAESGPPRVPNPGRYAGPEPVKDLTARPIGDQALPAEENEASTAQLIARLPLPPARGESVASLVERLDAGLAACEWPLAPEADPEGDEVSSDDRLRSAIDELQKMARRSH